MKSEEKLNHLFEALKAEKASTSVADVTSWIQASAQVSAPKSTSKSIIQKNFFILSTIVTTLIVGGFLFLSGNKETKRTPPQKNTSKEATFDTSESVVKQANQLPVYKEFSEIPFIQPLIDLDIKPLPFIEIDNEPAIIQLDPISSSQHSSITNNQSNTGSWLSSNDSLFVDTLFGGVKSLVFKGDKCDLLVRGSERSDVSMKYEYQLKAKGVFNRKNQGNCELSYERKDSVLTIRVKRKDQNFNGVSVLSETSTLEFYVPNNIDVKMNSDLGDITAENVSGNIDLNTDLGDISMRKLEGKINSVTSLGDIDGEYILISDNSKFNTSLGDIDVQLSNPLSDCSLDLSSSLGKVKVDRPELKKKSGSQLNIGNGKLKVIMETSLGSIKVR
jgi:hypothetical protein